MRLHEIDSHVAVLAFALLLVPPMIFASGGNKQQQAAALFERAEKLTNIWTKGSPAFVLDAKITLYGRAGSSENGIYHEIWESDGESIGGIEFPDYHNITVDHAGKTWHSSTLLYLPYPVYQLKRVVAFARRLKLPLEEKLKNINSRKVDEMSAVCAAFAEKKSRKQHRFCFDHATGYLIREENPTWLTTLEFGDYAPFGEKFFPRTLRVLQSGQLIVEAKVTSIAADPKINAQVLVPPPGILPSSLPHCEGYQRTYAKAIFQPVPRYPIPGKMNRITGTVVIYAEIGKDGVPRGLTVLASPGPEFSQNSLAAVRQWRYQPSTCVGIPLETFTAIDVSFKLRE